MRVIITVGELIDRGRWEQACGVLGIGEWAVNEGQMDRDDELVIEAAEALRIGLVEMTDKWEIIVKEEP